MKALLRFLIGASVMALILVIGQQRQINASRAELARSQANAGPSASEASAPAEEPVVTPEEVARLREENRDIHKLRGQITQAREKRKAVDRLRAETEQLRQRLAQARANPASASTPPFPLSNKGDATPEAALETFFWAMYRGDLEILKKLMPEMAHEIDKMPPEEKTNSIVMGRAVASTIEKFEILSRETPSANEVDLTVRITRRSGMGLRLSRDEEAPEDSTFIMQRINNHWRILDQR